MNKRFHILGVPIDNVSMQETVERLCIFAASDTPHHVMTPNPEMLVAAQKNPAFFQLLQKTALNVPDGAGLLWAARFLGGSLKERVTGTDLTEAIAACPDLQPVFFLGAAEGVAAEAARLLQKVHPTLVVAGTYAGSPAIEEESDILRRIQSSGAKTLLVAYGAPAQDLWIDRVLPKLPSVRIAMGVGGAFDFFAGKQKRAPMWLRSMGLEWLWRLIKQPSRLPRILTAVLVFPFLVFTHRRGASLDAEVPTDASQRQS